MVSAFASSSLAFPCCDDSDMLKVFVRDWDLLKQKGTFIQRKTDVGFIWGGEVGNSKLVIDAMLQLQQTSSRADMGRLHRLRRHLSPVWRLMALIFTVQAVFGVCGD